MATTARPYPCLWLSADLEEAARYYTGLLPDSSIDRVWRSPLDTPSGAAGTVLTVSITIAGQPYLLLAGGPVEFPFNESVSFVIETDDQAETDRLWEALTADGGEPGVCGWVKDRYGLSWQITPRRLLELTADDDPHRAAAAMTAMMRMTKIEVADLESAVADA